MLDQFIATAVEVVDKAVTVGGCIMAAVLFYQGACLVVKDARRIVIASMAREDKRREARRREERELQACIKSNDMTPP